jgi:hypothetical protein
VRVLLPLLLVPPPLLLPPPPPPLLPLLLPLPLPLPLPLAGQQVGRWVKVVCQYAWERKLLWRCCVE